MGTLSSSLVDAGFIHISKRVACDNETVTQASCVDNDRVVDHNAVDLRVVLVDGVDIPGVART
jgi:hypothetical protein